MYYLTDSNIGFTLKIESVTKNTIFGLKMMVKSGVEKFFLKSLHELVILGTFMKWGKVVSCMEEFQKYVF